MLEEPDVLEDISRMHQKKVVIHAGDADLAETGRILYVEPDWTTDDLLQAAGRRLELVSTPKRLFNCNGMEVADVMMIEDQEVIFFTHGTDYVAPSPREGDGAKVSWSSSGLPAVVGLYKVCEFLGKGGFGEVRVGRHQLTGERVALKFLRKSSIADMGAAERTTTEIQCLTALKHPNIIRLIQHINSPLNVIMVFELAEGGDLFQFLCNAPGQRVDEDEGRAVFRQIISGVGYAHNQHICHRDMKLDNVLLSRPGCLQEVKIADFGLSDFYRPGATMRTNCGSISYLAPEVFRGTSNAGPPLDVWSIGVILFALLCGRLPFEGIDLKGTNRPKEATIRRRILECRYKPVESLYSEDLLRRMLKLDPNERASVPEIFNHSWLRFKNVTSIDHQPGRKDECDGLRDAFQNGPDGSFPSSSSGNSPRISMISRGPNSPRLGRLSSRAVTPSPGVAADCKAPSSPPPLAPISPRRYQTERGLLESKALGQSLSIGTDLDLEGIMPSDEAADMKAEERATFQLRQDDDDDIAREAKIELVDRNRTRSGSDSDDSRASRASQGGFGRDFSTSMNPVRGSQTSVRSVSPGEGMIRINSRLGLTHPARSKTLSSLGLTGNTLSPITVPGTSGGGGVTTGAGITGGAMCKSPRTAGGLGNRATIGGMSEPRGGGVVVRRIPGVMKSRTIDLTHHLSMSSTESQEASPGPFSRLEQRGPDMVRQRRQYSGDGESDKDRSDQETKYSPESPAVDGRRSARSRNAEDDGRNVRTSIVSTLPPLSPKATSAVKSERDLGYDEKRKRLGSDPLTPHGDGGNAEPAMRFCSMRGEEQKSPRGSTGLSPIRSPHRPGSLKPHVASADGTKTDRSYSTWAGWNQSKERDAEDDDGTLVRLPPSPRGSLTRSTSGVEEDSEEHRGEKNRPQGECKLPVSPRL